MILEAHDDWMNGQMDVGYGVIDGWLEDANMDK